MLGIVLGTADTVLINWDPLLSQSSHRAEKQGMGSTRWFHKARGKKDMKGGPMTQVQF